MIIAIDGPAGAGKGTIAGYLAMKFNLLHLDTGLLYRALAKSVISEGVDPQDIISVANIARTIKIGDIQSPNLRGEEVAAVASQVAIIPEVREILNTLQREFCQTISAPYEGAILDGRDIGTVVFPHADCKLFVTACSEIRNQRRLLETLNSSTITDKLTQKMAERDARDMSRQIAPLTPAENAYKIDTSDLTIDEACKLAASYVVECCLGKSIHGGSLSH